MKSCKNCLLPENVEGVSIGSDGVCNICRNYRSEDVEANEHRRMVFAEDLEKALQDCRGRGMYDCLVPFSGGKDSIYLLYKLKVEYKLKVLAYTTNANIPDLAWKNIRSTLKKLDIEHIAYTPSPELYKKLFRYLFQHQEQRGAVYTISYVYAPLFEGDAIRLALEKDIPLILAGYSPGQPDPERMLYEFAPELISNADWTPPALKESGAFTQEELRCFFNPATYPQGTQFPRYLAPFHAWPYSQDRIMAEVVRLQLVPAARYTNPILTNYPINWLCMYSDLKHFGYNPYQPEFSALIREGKARRLYWRIMRPIVNTMIEKKIFLGREVKRCMEWLELNEDDLEITLPKGAYDPEW
jgi:hypothetical protein